MYIYVLYLLTLIFLAKIIMCTFAHPCPILVSAVLPLFLNGCRKVSGGSKQGLGTASWVFVLVLISRNFLLRIFNLFLKHPSKKGEKRIKEISIHIPLYIHVGILLFMMLCDISFLFVLLLSGYDDLPSH